MRTRAVNVARRDGGLPNPPLTSKTISLTPITLQSRSSSPPGTSALACFTFLSAIFRLFFFRVKPAFLANKPRAFRVASLIREITRVKRLELSLPIWQVARCVEQAPCRKTYTCYPQMGMALPSPISLFLLLSLRQLAEIWVSRFAPLSSWPTSGLTDSKFEQ